MGPLTRDRALPILTGVQERLDDALRQGTAAYHAAFDRTPPGVAVHELDAQGVIVRVNAEEQRVLGYPAERMVGRPAWEFIVMNEVSQRAIAQKLAGQKELKPFVRTFRHAAGRAITMLLVDRLRRDAQGHIAGLRTALMEIQLEEGAANG